MLLLSLYLLRCESYLFLLERTEWLLFLCSQGVPCRVWNASSLVVILFVCGVALPPNGSIAASDSVLPQPLPNRRVGGVTGDSTFQSCDINPAPDAAQASRRRQRVAHHSHHFDHCKCRDDGDHYCTCAFCFRRRQSPYMGFANVDDGAPATSVPKEWW